MQLKPLQHVAACITITFSLRGIRKWSPAARLDILRAVLLKIQVFWDVMPCGLIIRMTLRRTAAKEVWTLKMKAQRSFETSLTLNPLTWKIWWARNNASRWQMGFNSAFKGLINYRSTRRTHPSKSCCCHKRFLVSRLLVFPLQVWNHCDLQLLADPQSSCTFAMNYAFSLSLSFAELSHRTSDAPTPTLRTLL